MEVNIRFQFMGNKMAEDKKKYENKAYTKEELDKINKMSAAKMLMDPKRETAAETLLKEEPKKDATSQAEEAMRKAFGFGKKNK